MNKLNPLLFNEGNKEENFINFLNTNMEKFSLEQAGAEAEKMQEQLKSGQATTYAEAERNVENEKFLYKVKEEIGFINFVNFYFNNGAENLESYLTQNPDIKIDLNNRSTLQKILDMCVLMLPVKTQASIERLLKKFDKLNTNNLDITVSDEILKRGRDIMAVKSYMDERVSGYDPHEITDNDESVQIAYETNLSDGLMYNRERINEIIETAKKRNLGLKQRGSIEEESYIRVLHNPSLGHANDQRQFAHDLLKKVASQLQYETVVKMDYLDYLEVPKEKQIMKEIIVEEDGYAIKSRAYGQISDLPKIGKYILGITRGKSVEFVFDETMGEHRDIGNKYDLEVIGGGLVRADHVSKKLLVYSASKDFGYESRSISEKIFPALFPDYEVVIGY